MILRVLSRNDHRKPRLKRRIAQAHMPSISLLVQVAALAVYPCGRSQLRSHPENDRAVRRELRRGLDQLKVGPPADHGGER